MKKFMALLLALLMALSLCACGSSTASGKLPGKSEDTVDTHVRDNSQLPGGETGEETGDSGKKVSPTSGETASRENRPQIQSTPPAGCSRAAVFQ